MRPKLLLSLRYPLRTSLDDPHMPLQVSSKQQGWPGGEPCLQGSYSLDESSNGMGDAGRGWQVICDCIAASPHPIHNAGCSSIPCHGIASLAWGFLLQGP